MLIIHITSPRENLGEFYKYTKDEVALIEFIKKTNQWSYLQSDRRIQE